ncbi:MAG TPA: SGNH/GDSL hydrolase family protein [Lapillicoccus sp.]|nr:SGNH/GDSL hydrolase family protein [Lapillicoccus sp.]
MRPPATMRRRLAAAGLIALVALGLGAAVRALAGLVESPVAATETHTVTAWGTSNDKADGSVTDITVRNIVNLTLGGTNVRVRLSNVSGTAPLVLSSVWVGTPTSASTADLVRGSNRQATFSGKATVTVPAGGSALTDVLPGSVAAHQKVAVSVAISGTSPVITAHNASRQDSFMSSTGDHAAEESSASFGTRSEAWYYLDAVTVSAPRTVSTVAALGDSITAGVGSSINENRRWTDYLAARLAKLPEPRRLGVTNEGISGNRLLTDGESTGPAGLTRLVHDVMTKPGITTLVLFEGINDIGGGASAASIVGGYQQAVAQAHAAGVCVVGATLTPAGSALGSTAEQTRRAVNEFIRTSGIYDHVVDFDAVTRDPAAPNQLRAEHDSGDHLHPSDAAYEAMANAIDLDALRC